MIKRLFSKRFCSHLIPKKNEHGDFLYLNPKETEDRLLRLISLHECVEGKEIKLNKTFEELNIDPLSKVELFLEIEREFYIEFPDKIVERFINFEEVKVYLSKSFHTM